MMSQLRACFADFIAAVSLWFRERAAELGPHRIKRRQVEQNFNVQKLPASRSGLCSVALLIVLATSSAVITPLTASAQAVVTLPFEEEAELDGVPYRILVPANWNGTLLVFAHAWHDRADHPGEVDDFGRSLAPAGMNLLLADGYALARSAFRNNGYAVKEGLQNSLALTGYFKDRVGKPAYTILWGNSLGGLIALEGIERFSAVYDAAIAFAAPAAGMPRTVDWSLALALAYHVTFGWPVSWGTLGDLDDNLDFETQVCPILSAQVSDPANMPKFEFIRRVSRLPNAAFSCDAVSATGLFFDMKILTEYFAELERRAHGPVWQNLDHVYTLPDSDRADLRALGLDPDALLAEMNAIRIPPNRIGRHYIEHYAEFTGYVTRPVLTVHGRDDPVAIVQHQSAYLATLQASSAAPWLVQAFTSIPGHGLFTGGQVLFAVQAMQGWLQTRVRPDTAAFPAALGFLPDFQPQEWPHVQP